LAGLGRNISGRNDERDARYHRAAQGGIEHRLRRYAYRPDGGAEQAADDLGVERERMYKRRWAPPPNGV
jgi:hypothetical protein